VSTKAEKEAKLGTGESARVTVGLKNQSKELKGYVSKIDEDNFVVTNLKTRETTTVAYRDVAYVHGKGLPTAATVAIIAGAAVGVLLLIWVFAFHAGND
jgi:hypothetical protein